MQSVAALLLVVVAVANAESLLSYIPANYHVHLNEQVKSELGKLSTKDLHALQEVAMKAPQMTSLAQLRNAINKASPEASILGAKYAALASITAGARYQQLKNKLSPKSQNMFGEIAGLATKAAKNFAAQAKKVYQKQDAATKSNLKQTFSYATLASNTPAGKAMMAHFSA